MQVALICWWCLLGVSCLLLVYFHGNRAKDKEESLNNQTPKDKILYDSLNQIYTCNEDEESDSVQQYTELRASVKLPNKVDPTDQSKCTKNRNSKGKCKDKVTVDKKVVSDDGESEDVSRTMWQGIKVTGHESGVTTVTRKYFHLVMLLVYVPGLVYVQFWDLMFQASTIAAALLLCIEVSQWIRNKSMNQSNSFDLWK